MGERVDVHAVGDNPTSTGETSKNSASVQSTASTVTSPAANSAKGWLHSLLSRIQEAIYVGAKRFASLPGTSGSWLCWAILLLLLFGAPSWATVGYGFWGCAIGLALLGYFLLDDWSIALWSIGGCSFTFVLELMMAVPRLKLIFPLLSVGVVVWCIWRWLNNVQILNEKKRAEAAQGAKPFQEIIYRSVWAELVFAMSILFTASSYIPCLINETMFGAIGSALGKPDAGWVKEFDSILYGMMVLRIVLAVIIIICALIYASLISTPIIRQRRDAMGPAHNLLKKQTFQELGDEIVFSCISFAKYVQQLGSSLWRVLKWNGHLLGLFGTDIILRGPVVFVFGGLVYRSVHPLIGGNGGIVEASCVILIIAALALIVQFNHISVGGGRSSWTVNNKSSVLEAFLRDAVCCWVALLFTCGLRLGLTYRPFGWTPVPRGMWICLGEVTVFLLTVLIVALFLTARKAKSTA